MTGRPLQRWPLVALAIAAFSIAFPSTPSYDPWSWLIWGREILHGQLRLAGGSSWKPLPVIFTTVFALFGRAQPNLWLLVARAGAVLAVLMSVKLTVRITWGLVAPEHTTDRVARVRWTERAATLAPALLAGAIALVGVVLARDYPVNSMLGYSEGLAAAAFLVAVERAWDGHPRQAFALGLIPSLARPEVWLVCGPYGLWLMWKDKGARPLVLGVGILVLLLWLVPPELAGTSAKGLVTHAVHNHHSDSAVNTGSPFWTEFSHVVWPLALARVEIASLLLLALTGFLVVTTRRAVGNWSSAIRRHTAAVAASLAAAFGFLWWLVIAVETQAGFAGNPRYAVLGVMFIYIGGCSAYGWACVGLARLGTRAMSRYRRDGGGTAGTRPARRSVSVVAGTLVMLAVFVFVPDWFTKPLPSITSIRTTLHYQARLREEVAALINEEGGPGKVLGCGSVLTSNSQVPMVEWYLNDPLPWIHSLPHTLEAGPGPNVVFQAGATSTDYQLPSPRQMQAWQQGWDRTGSSYKIIRTDPVTLYVDCSSKS